MPAIINGFLYNDVLSIHPGRIVQYLQPDDPPKKRNGIPVARSEEQKKRENARRIHNRMHRSLTLLYDSSKRKRVFQASTRRYFTFKCTFVTLTLPSSHSLTEDEVQKKALSPFIRILKKQHPNLLYVWRKETTKSGTIHYHVITNQFIHHQWLRDNWNIILNRAGINQKLTANSTDIHSLKNAKDPIRYMLKYITKQLDDKSGLTGKVWDCSAALKKVQPTRIINPGTLIMEQLTALIKQVKNTIHYDYCSVTYLSKKQLKPYPLLYKFYLGMLTELIANNLAASDKLNLV